MTAMYYDAKFGELSDYIVSETSFDIEDQGKCEAIMTLGNGRIGLRSATEETYPKQTRGMFISGTFNRFAPSEFNELPNCADIVGTEITLDGERFDLTCMEILAYQRSLNLYTGELVRVVRFRTICQKEYLIEFHRFVSRVNLNLIGSSIKITPMQDSEKITFTSGINGRMTNSGVQHFEEIENRIFEKNILQTLHKTNTSGVKFIYSCFCNLLLNGQKQTNYGYIGGRRQNIMSISASPKANQTLEWTKLSTVYTSMDSEYRNKLFDFATEQQKALTEIKMLATKTYDKLLAASSKKWANLWDNMDIKITGNHYDQLAIRFAQYHLIIMSPIHDDRFSIGAKGFSGEGYFGHAFWDNEIFILPFFIYTYPEYAASLLRYRFNTLPGARKKAIANGFSGAMYPWESALSGEEETPEFAGVNPHTGKPYKIWTGFIEQHITSDVAFCVWEYFQITNDVEFMTKYGYEIIMDCANFWCSRLEFNTELNRYEINDVIGPDEYKEHVNNNAFTNYLAHWTINTAERYFAKLEKNSTPEWQKLKEKLSLNKNVLIWRERLQKIYLPTARPDGVIPQDDTYLTLREIDLTKYKNQTSVGLIYGDYSPEELSDIQVSKQADIMVLFYLLEDLFSQEVKRANWHYYEPKTVHDSSLSLSTHCVLACDIGDMELAYKLFNQAARIDLGPDMHSSDHGIHAASLGGIWQCVVCGFGGLRMLNGNLRIAPKLPEKWEKLEYSFYWHGDKIQVIAHHHQIRLINVTGNNSALELEINGRNITLYKEVEL